MLLIHQIIKRTFIRSIWEIWSALVLLTMLFQWLAQTRYLGEGHYDFLASCQYVLLTTPRNAYRVIPITFFLSSYHAFNQLEQHKICFTIRILGVTWRHIMSMLLRSFLPLLIGAFILGNLIAPNATQLGKIQKSKAISGHAVRIQNQQTTWLREGKQILHFNFNPQDNTQADHITTWSISPKTHALTQFQTAAKATYNKNTKRWKTTSTPAIQFETTPIKLTKTKPQPYYFHYNPYLITLSKRPPEQQSLSELWAAQKSDVTNITETSLIFWQKISEPITLIALLFLGLLALILNDKIQHHGARLVIIFIVFISIYFINETLALLCFLSGLPILLSVSACPALYLALDSLMLYHLAQNR